MSSYNDPTLEYEFTDSTSTGNSYIQNVENVTAADKNIPFLPYTRNNAYIEMRNSIGGSTAQNTIDLDAFFQSFNINTKSLPESWESFSSAYASYFNKASNDPVLTNIYNQLKQLFTASSGALSDWGVGGSPLISTATEVDSDKQFKAAFADFLKTFAYGADGSLFAPGSPTSHAKRFFDGLSNFLGTISTSTSTGLNRDENSVSGVTTNSATITNYQQAWSYFVGGNNAAFTSEFRDYYFEVVAREGYFHTGRALDGWINRLWNASIQAQGDSTYKLAVESRKVSSNFSSIVNTGANAFWGSITVLMNDFVAGKDKLQLPGSFIDLGNGKIAEVVSSSDDPVIMFIQAFDGPSHTNVFLTKDEVIAVVRKIEYINEDPNNNPGNKVITIAIPPIPLVAYDPDTNPNGLQVQGGDFTLAAPQVVVTSVSSEHTKRVLVLQRIFALLAEIIGSLQSISASQAGQITFLTNWQKTFTDMITQVQTYSRGDKSIYGLTSDNATTDQRLAGELSSANEKMINLRETLTAWRGIVQDTAKREQTRLNQTQDAVTQQSNMATSILQEFSTILGSIFK